MKYFNVLILVVAVTVAHKSLANELKATQQRLSETYRYDFMDVREQYQLTRFNLRGIRSLSTGYFVTRLRHYWFFQRRCFLAGYMNDITL